MYEYNEMMELEELFEGMMGINLLSSLWSMLISIATYVLMAVGMYTIAKRRGIHNPWLAWVPFGSSWMLGCISDQYRYVAKGQEKSKRKVLLTLEIITSVVLAVTLVLFFVSLFHLMMEVESYEATLGNGNDLDYARLNEMLAPMLGSVGLILIASGVAIAYTVVYYMALHDLYASCSPENATIYTVLSIFLSGILPAILVFASRNKEGGMPPRQQVMYSEQPVWQPPQPPVEPWELNNEE